MQWKNQRGFTLMELVVVLAILAVMGALVLPQFAQRLTEERFVSAVYQVHSDLRLAQEAAKREQCSVKVNFYPLDKMQIAYVIYFMDMEHTLIKKAELPPGIKIDYTQDTFVDFGENGHVDHNGHIVFKQEKMKRSIYFYQTGRVRISAGKI